MGLRGEERKGREMGLGSRLDHFRHLVFVWEGLRLMGFGRR